MFGPFKQAYMILRPHVREFLQAMAKIYEVRKILIVFMQMYFLFLKKAFQYLQLSDL